MKSDKTEVILLGAAAAVIALVVAYSFMGNETEKGKKRSREEDGERRSVVQRLANVEGSLETTKEQLDELGNTVDPDSKEGKEVQTLKEQAKTLAKDTAKQIGAAALTKGKEVAIEKVAEIREMAAQQLQVKAGQLADKAKEKAGELATQAKDTVSSWIARRNPFSKN